MVNMTAGIESLFANVIFAVETSHLAESFDLEVIFAHVGPKAILHLLHLRLNLSLQTALAVVHLGLNVRDYGTPELGYLCLDQIGNFICCGAGFRVARLLLHKSARAPFSTI